MADEQLRVAGLRLKIDGAAEYQKSLTQLAASMQKNTAELNKLAVQYSTTGQSVEALTAKKAKLEDKLTSQQAVTAKLKDILVEVKNQYGENSAQVEKFETKIIQSEAAEEKLKNQISQIADQLTKSSQGFADNSLQMDKNSAALALLEAKYGSNTKSVEFLSEKQKNLQQQLQLQEQELTGLQSVLTQTEEKYGTNSTEAERMRISVLQAQTGVEKLKNELKDNEKVLRESQSSLKQYGDSFQEFGKKMQDAGDKAAEIGKKLSLGVTTPLLAAGTYAAKMEIDFESAFAGVRKTVDATDEQLAELRRGFEETALSIPATTTELSAVGEAAGQLGIHTDSILEFTRVMVDMGSATNMTSDVAAETMARFANITQMNQDSFDRLGSTVVDLGNKFAGTESEIMEMGLRLAGAGKTASMLPIYLKCLM